jgi:hypothetical protein
MPAYFARDFISAFALNFTTNLRHAEADDRFLLECPSTQPPGLARIHSPTKMDLHLRAGPL